ncbi:molybdopterin-dependent oxidoreductase [Sulfurovum sp. NBC37-1]|uniref:molybdopterin-dependent oxidoreductase n=1 Tax=Sulfurovum sp. (strain NBC37-1) TaxID=387093 RepID=UPI0001587672|nr:molybdopterin-dependent oxidoreductase [Sulfurovum sp. NBC37-1]BAF71546.1 molybdopterin oxidoreductase [Sulfurovum sp. NBC37-1]
MKETACGLDCYDACRIIVEDDKFKMKGDKEHPAGNGALCALLNKHMFETPRIEKPRIDGREVSMEEAMQAVAEAFKAEKSLLWRGSGNLGVMQEITDLFMEKIDGTLTRGSLCDGAGDAGIIMGRGINRNLPLEQIGKAETVVVWGRNVTVTNSHIMPFLEGKHIVVIDPVKTAIAKKADLHIQIQPRTDYYVAIMLARFIFMEDTEDTEWMDEFAPEYEDFYDYTREHRIKAILAYIGVDLGDMGRILNYLRDRKVVFLVGSGVQKYSTGAYTMHAIDSLAATLGLFGKEGCGVSYLSNSKLGFENPFEVECKRVPKATTEFSSFETVLVQGGNPAESMPDSNGVIKELEAVENLIYFGLYENETSKRAKIVIPAKNFFEKEDVRLSYGHQYVQKMNKILDSDIGISEYDFTRRLFNLFGFDGLQSEEYYLDAWLSQCEREGEHYISPAHQDAPYAEGFGEEDDEFEFIDEFEDDFINTKRFRKYRKESKNKPKDESFWLLTPKSSKSLNTQFVREDTVQLPPDTGYTEGERVKVSSEHGSAEFTVRINEDLRPDCLIITANTVGVNYLTPCILSDGGENACYQEVKVLVERV